MEEAKKKYRKNLEKSKSENLFIASLEKLQGKEEAKDHGIGWRRAT